MRRVFSALLLLGTCPAVAAAQQPAAPAGSLSLLDAIALGRKQAVEATIARLNVREADARTAQRRADLLPDIAGSAGVTRQTVNLDEFGIPIATGVTDPFTIWRLQVRASQTVFDASAITRLRAAHDTAAAAGLDAQAIGQQAGATAGLAYLRLLSTQETVKAREADSTVAAELLDEARQLVAAGVSPAIDATRSEVSFGSGTHPARGRPEQCRSGPPRSLENARPSPRLSDHAGGLPRSRRAQRAARTRRGRGVRTRASDRGRRRAGTHDGGGAHAQGRQVRESSEPRAQWELSANRAAYCRPRGQLRGPAPAQRPDSRRLPPAESRPRRERAASGPTDSRARSRQPRGDRGTPGRTRPGVRAAASRDRGRPPPPRRSRSSRRPANGSRVELPAVSRPPTPRAR